MHIAKYKREAVGHMLAHYQRDAASLKRDNVHAERTHENYHVGMVEHRAKLPTSPRERRETGLAYKERRSWYAERDDDRYYAAESVAKEIERADQKAVEEGRRKTRKDAVVMADIVVTLPDNVPLEDAEKFFCACYSIIRGKIREQGGGKFLGGFVHMDEKTPHMHMPFLPVMYEDGAFAYKRLIKRGFYKSLHGDVERRLEKALGYRPHILLDDEKKAEKALSKVPQKDLDAARAAIIEPAEQRAAEARKELAAAQAELQRCKDGIAEAEAAFDAASEKQLDAEEQLAAELERLECLRQANDAIESRVVELESIAADAGRYASESRAGKVALVSRVADAVDRVRAGFDRGLAVIRKAVSAMRGILPSREEQLQKGCVAYAPDFFRGRQAASAAQDRARATEQARTASQSHTRDSERRRGR